MSIPATRLEAVRTGAPRYRGSPCLKGHHSGRYTASQNCVECKKISADRYIPESPQWHCADTMLGKRMAPEWRDAAYAGQVYEDIKMKQKTPRPSVVHQFENDRD